MLAGKSELPIATVVWQGEYAVPPDAEILIRATTKNSGDARLPLAINSLRPELLVADVTPGLLQTPLLGEAAERGCTTVNGLAIFIEQVAASFQLWTGVDPNREVLCEAIEEFLEL
jgi:shikimate dehydrogenase